MFQVVCVVSVFDRRDPPLTGDEVPVPRLETVLYHDLPIGWGEVDAAMAMSGLSRNAECWLTTMGADMFVDLVVIVFTVEPRHAEVPGSGSA